VTKWTRSTWTSSDASLHLFALQAPVATDLRLLTALLHINLHLERVGDQAVNLAKIAKGSPRSNVSLPGRVHAGPSC
jgi:phosphate uptake regulator